jgi:hypothetical protein
MTVGRRANHRAAFAALAALLFVACQQPDPASPSQAAAALELTFGGGACSPAETRLEFASVQQGRASLRRSDAFARQLSSFDIGARRRTLEATSLSGFLEFASREARDWTPSEVAGWMDIAGELSDAAKGLKLGLHRVPVVKTTGREEFESSGYTRQHAIVITQVASGLPSTDRRRAFFLLAHELFHVVSRANPAYRDALYSLLGFEPFDGFNYPAELEARRLSNPDAFGYGHALTVQTPVGNADVVPVNQSAVPLEEAIHLPSIFAVLGILLLSVDTGSGEVHRDDGGNVIAFNFGNTDWVPLMRRNSAFIIHPEEVLADNFATLMEWRATGEIPAANPSNVPTNDVALLTSMQDVLTQGCGG